MAACIESGDCDRQLKIQDNACVYINSARGTLIATPTARRALAQSAMAITQWPSGTKYVPELNEMLAFNTFRLNMNPNRENPYFFEKNSAHSATRCEIKKFMNEKCD